MRIGKAIEELIPTFSDKMLSGPRFEWWQQVVKPGQSNEDWSWQGKKQPLDFHDLKVHFSQDLHRSRGSKFASVAVCGRFLSDRCKFMCFDCDSSEIVARAQSKLIPVLEAYGIEYIWEYSGTPDNERAHIWFCVDCSFETLHALVNQLLIDAELKPTDFGNNELFPTHRRKNGIRLPGGFHIRYGKVFPICYRGQIGGSAQFVMNAFIQAEQWTEEKIGSVLRPVQASTEAKAFSSLAYVEKILYVPRNLALPEGLGTAPESIKDIARNCQSTNRLISDSVNQKLLDEQTGFGHKAGLYLSNFAQYKDSTGNGLSWVKDFVQQHRSRSADSHNWFDNPEKKCPDCSTLEQDFDWCKGCPYKGQVLNPKQFYTGKPIRRHPSQDSQLLLVTAQEVRDTTFGTVHDDVIQLYRHQGRCDKLIASPMGTGKSLLLDNIAVNLASDGAKVLISVHSAEVALEHRNRIEAFKGKAFVLFGHENLFSKLNPGFDCPNAEIIQNDTACGGGISEIVEKYCRNCPFVADCPYPSQYKLDRQEKASVHHDSHRIVIIQHAHLANQKVMDSLRKNHFDAFLVDEQFIEHIVTFVKKNEALGKALRQRKKFKEGFVPWLLEGGKAKDRIAVDISEIRQIQQRCLNGRIDSSGLLDLIGAYNRGGFMTKDGVFEFQPLPDIPIRVFADATAPAELIQMITNGHVETPGKGEILDYRQSNPENRVFQVLDGWASKRSMHGEDGEKERLFNLMQFVVDKARTDLADAKILVTVYQEDEQDIRTWIERNYPDLANRIVVDHMAVGTNRFEDFDVQVLLCGVHFNEQQLKTQIAKLHAIKEYWRCRALGYEPGVSLLAPSEIPVPERTLKRLCRVEVNDGVACTVEYPDFEERRPRDELAALAFDMARAQTQQAIRLRFNDDRRKLVYVFGRGQLPTLLITDSVPESFLLSLPVPGKSEDQT